MKRSSLLPSKSRPIVKFRGRSIRSGTSDPTRFHLVVFLLLLLSSLDLWILPFRPFVGFIKHDNTTNQKPKPNREVGRNSSFWECTTVGSCPSCHSYQSMDDDFVWCKVPRCREKAPDSCRVITQVGSFLPAFDNKEVPPLATCSFYF